MRIRSLESGRETKVVKGQLEGKKTDGYPRTEQELQSPSEECLQGCRGYRLEQARPVAGVLCSFSGERHAAGNGAADLGQKIATIVLIVWKRGVCFDAHHLKPQTA